MRTKILTAVAALAFMAACSSAPEDTGSTGASGATSSSSYGSGQGTVSTGAQPGSWEYVQQTAGDRVFFELDSSSLTAEGRQTLSVQADFLRANPAQRIVIEGHADERGTREYNLALGDRRATAAKNYLVALGISPDRIETISYGKERPAVLGSDEAAWAQNRRAVTVLVN
ncbi:MAG: peptidoglycan-associated lipoprotein [Tistrella sp.]|jgi:peptidoglycan-associated lipoprotein|uniref:Peptidoglycan-associated lipoprotein n=2 Tax=Tistrella mobilis TaxID=171437 RepID=I3TJ09_TISMK|nr:MULTISPECIES: peptidoglycan-associated lipoprotein Pal [Tistrella]AFK52747.1 Outer membrane protein and related peptidoglycan-associated lipo protein [Tistrella mobilis KA081020-065]KYO49749.1 cell envelope biogenesis protein OmpA [Tistrella mobilis]MAD40549.1 peptidoglycan-associated lipoprotein [Tistrella sp.]MAM76186.1 peptidoglycan-associated lipoprotein [Tistrella sp.]MBA78977.1 peptidoglycan-associated lipoprotein [Tistrella sp.]|tara:strand:- start:62 stop:574 length:513 start_codon:yes stop_codon:yes gene_type:complete